MRKFWSLLFFLVPVFSIGIFVAAPSFGWWLPENVSTYGGDIDHLFYVILWITGVTFVITQVALPLFIWKYGTQPGLKALYTHGNHRLEVIWTIIPAAILVFIAFYQFGAWKDVKFRNHLPPNTKPLAEIMAGQFEWRFKYAGPDGELNTEDDVHSLNSLHVPVNTPVILNLRTRDVLHSFFVPVFRLKQDAVPGMTIPIWFEATKTGNFELVCAELCGWGHYKMRGMVTVESPSEFQAWLTKTKAEEEAYQ